MKVCGFTFIRNAQKYDYPVVEAILSIIDLCDHIVVAVGLSEDNTLELIKSINNSKIQIIETIWDDNLRNGGKVLADETNKAFQAISNDYDWCFYIQADEVLHEKYIPTVKQAMIDNLNNKNIDGLLFKYLHFYGSYDYVGESLHWYPHEIRIIRNNKNFYSYKDAQGFRKYNNKLLNVKPIDAYIYHYGWVKEPKTMLDKQLNFNKLWHDDNWINKRFAQSEEFDYSQIDSLKKFESSHPAVITQRINKINWKFEHDLSCNKLRYKDKIKLFFQKFGISIGQYKNYKIK